MANDVMYEFRPAVEGQALLGVPARDLTLADVELLEPIPKAELEANLKRGDDALYKQVMNKTEARQAARQAAGGRKRTVRRSRRRTASMTDPDVNAPGRVDSDQLGGPGSQVPPTDEPIGEAGALAAGGAAGSYVQTDTGGSAPQG